MFVSDRRIAEPDLEESYASAHHPSSTERFRAAVHQHFHAARPAGFPRAPGSIDPDVDSRFLQPARASARSADSSEYGPDVRDLEQERWPFISRKPPRKSQCQYLRIQHRLRLVKLEHRCSVSRFVRLSRSRAYFTKAARPVDRIRQIRWSSAVRTAASDTGQISVPPFLPAELGP